MSNSGPSLSNSTTNTNSISTEQVSLSSSRRLSGSDSAGRSDATPKSTSNSENSDRYWSSDSYTGTSANSDSELNSVTSDSNRTGLNSARTSNANSNGQYQQPYQQNNDYSQQYRIGNDNLQAQPNDGNRFQRPDDTVDQNRTKANLGLQQGPGPTRVSNSESQSKQSGSRNLGRNTNDYSNIRNGINTNAAAESDPQSSFIRVDNPEDSDMMIQSDNQTSARSSELNPLIEDSNRNGDAYHSNHVINSDIDHDYNYSQNTNRPRRQFRYIHQYVNYYVTFNNTISEQNCERILATLVILKLFSIGLALYSNGCNFAVPTFDHIPCNRQVLTATGDTKFGNINNTESEQNLKLNQTYFQTNSTQIGPGIFPNKLNVTGYMSNLTQTETSKFGYMGPSAAVTNVSQTNQNLTPFAPQMYSAQFQNDHNNYGPGFNQQLYQQQFLSQDSHSHRSSTSDFSDGLRPSMPAFNRNNYRSNIIQNRQTPKLQYPFQNQSQTRSQETTNPSRDNISNLHLNQNQFQASSASTSSPIASGSKINSASLPQIKKLSTMSQSEKNGPNKQQQNGAKAQGNKNDKLKSESVSKLTLYSIFQRLLDFGTKNFNLKVQIVIILLSILALAICLIITIACQARNQPQTKAFPLVDPNSDTESTSLLAPEPRASAANKSPMTESVRFEQPQTATNGNQYLHKLLCITFFSVLPACIILLLYHVAPDDPIFECFHINKDVNGTNNDHSGSMDLDSNGIGKKSMASKLSKMIGNVKQYNDNSTHHDDNISTMKLTDATSSDAAEFQFAQPFQIIGGKLITKGMLKQQNLMTMTDISVEGLSLETFLQQHTDENFTKALETCQNHLKMNQQSKSKLDTHVVFLSKNILKKDELQYTCFTVEKMFFQSNIEAMQISSNSRKIKDGYVEAIYFSDNGDAQDAEVMQRAENAKKTAIAKGGGQGAIDAAESKIQQLSDNHTGTVSELTTVNYHEIQNHSQTQSTDQAVDHGQNFSETSTQIDCSWCTDNLNTIRAVLCFILVMVIIIGSVICLMRSDHSGSSTQTVTTAVTSTPAPAMHLGFPAFSINSPVVLYGLIAILVFGVFCFIWRKGCSGCPTWPGSMTMPFCTGSVCGAQNPCQGMSMPN